MRAVKKYHRPAAGNEAPLPEDVRSPPVLWRTLEYLLGQILDDSVTASASRPAFPFSDKHKFVRDRTRSIRQDITLQQRAIEGRADWLAMVVEMHEIIARFHILSGHRLCESDFSNFDPFQNTEQLRKVLQSLQEYYVDIRRLLASSSTDGSVLAGALRNEPEFRAYQLLTHAEDQDVFRQALALVPKVFASGHVQFALRCVSAYHQGDYVKYFVLATQADYLQACLLHTHFSKLRRKALTIISKAFTSKESLAAADLARWLAIEAPDELTDLLETYGGSLDATHMQVYLPPNVSEDDSPVVKARQSRFIEAKVADQSPTSSLVRGPPPPPTGSTVPRPVTQLHAPVPAAGTAAPPPLKASLAPQTGSDFTGHIAATMASNLLDFVKVCELDRLCRDAISAERARRLATKSQTVNRVTQLTLSSLLREIHLDVCTDWLGERRRLFQASQYRTAVIDTIRTSLAAGLVRNVVRHECKLLCRRLLSNEGGLGGNRSGGPMSVRDESIASVSMLMEGSQAMTTPRSKLRRIRGPTDMLLETGPPWYSLLLMSQ